ncbi:Glutamate-rich WD repeat-containing protein 1 [Trichoplax sp. H2]|uniref:Glutamate-rich WD repeat-containing protein 1 n=1 Tax=Trichoplax adhaerens TaxID=10228 RepID=B3SBY5_TRIAD|nr:expressed hypothetical protein [Trichoplax adhaerens]EDV19756.1 expressed hypothetical protein [Trichoplax adhaerens]RDD38841.1 Glutamate-rich WD repeat-containing protein 1 [Trichoplax sp. H2]|eukprot:XP_002117780.1 expressed hypothetical protein [Trichoplax adhaerens]
MIDSENENDSQETKVYVPHNATNATTENDDLVMEESAYYMYHAAQTGYPCLSFSVVPDSLGENRTEFPMTAYLVAGTQADEMNKNSVIVVKMSNLHKTYKEGDCSDSDEEQKIDCGPSLDIKSIHHEGAVNRIRHALIPNRHIVSTWSDTGCVHIWDISKELMSIDKDDENACIGAGHSRQTPLFSFNKHSTEGFAMDWSKIVYGRQLLTGDQKKDIYLWNPINETWAVEPTPFQGHTKSVEDLQWSPNEDSVFASCSVDKTVKFWDIRIAKQKGCMISVEAHSDDVNVISWNNNDPFLLSGGDDGILNVWDLRRLQSKRPVATFKHHQAPITSVEWYPIDSTVFAAAGADDQLTVWDLALEKDVEANGEHEDIDVPPQLLFIHQGQKDIKELHWHSQLPGVIISTAQDGFNIFKTISV